MGEANSLGLSFDLYISAVACELPLPHYIIKINVLKNKDFLKAIIPYNWNLDYFETL